MKWLAVICGAISIGCLSYIAYKKYRMWQDRREMLRAVEELRTARGKVKLLSSARGLGSSVRVGEGLISCLYEVQGAAGSQGNVESCRGPKGRQR